MKKFICLASVIVTTVYTCYYMHFGGLFGNKSALSTVGLEHHGLFVIWGVMTFITLAINIIYALKDTKYKLMSLTLIISLIGMVLTLIFDFEYAKHTEYMLHCIGSLTFSAAMGVTVFLTFLLQKKYIRAAVCGAILLTDMILLFIYKETALIEVVPIFAGYILLLSNNFEKELELVEVK